MQIPPRCCISLLFIISNYLYIPLGGTFGSITSPANFEPIARARIHLAEYLSNRRDLYHKFKHIIDEVKFSEKPSATTKFVQATKDSIHKGVIDLEKTRYNMFVDDNLFTQTKEFMKHAMAASIEALYMILGYPDIKKRQNPLSLDKYFESVCSYTRIQLGISVNTRTYRSRRSPKLHESCSGTFSSCNARTDSDRQFHRKRPRRHRMDGVASC